MEGEIDLNSSSVAVNENVQLMPNDSEVDNGQIFKKKTLKVDAVLCYQVDEDENEKEKEKAGWRERYLDSLMNDYGLDCETVGRQEDYGSMDDKDAKKDKLKFIKVHAPIDILYYCAEEMQLKMPTRPNDIEIKEWYEGRAWDAFNKLDPFRLRKRRTTVGSWFFLT